MANVVWFRAVVSINEGAMCGAILDATPASFTTLEHQSGKIVTVYCIIGERRLNEDTMTTGEPLSAQDILIRYASQTTVPEVEGHLLDHEARKGAFPGPRNDQGYRADSFADRKDINVAFLGCSWCEGMGVARRSIHSELVSRLVSKKTGRSVASWNCGLGGTGIDYILRMAPIMCNALQPDYFVLVLPNGNRREFFLEDGRRVSYYPGYSNHAKRFVPDSDRLLREAVVAFDSLSNPIDETMKYVIYFRAISAILDKYRIPWRFSWTADQNGRNRWLDSALQVAEWPMENFLGSHFNQVDVASAEDPHPGPQSHRLFAREVSKWIVKDYLDQADRPPDPNMRKLTISGLRSRLTKRIWRRPVAPANAPDTRGEGDADDTYPMW